MEIADLQIGQDIILEAKSEANELQFSTTIVGIDEAKRVVYAAPIEKNGKVLAFDSAVVNAIFTVENDKPRIFRGVTIAFYRTADHKLMYRIRLKGQGMPFNRRNAYRCFVGSKVFVQIGTNRSTMPAVLKDISSSGFALVVMKEEIKDHNLGIGATCHTVLTDVIDQFNKININLHGAITRISELEDGRVIYGCALMMQSYEIDKYIRIKERMNLAMKQMGASIRKKTELKKSYEKN